LICPITNIISNIAVVIRSYIGAGIRWDHHEVFKNSISFTSEAPLTIACIIRARDGH